MQSVSLQAFDALAGIGAIHPRVTLADIEANIAHLNYFTAGTAVGSIQACDGLDADYPESLDLLTICLLTTRNGFTIIGKSAPASAENFDAEKGKTFAYEDAVKQLWPLMDYALRDRLAGGEQPITMPPPATASYNPMNHPGGLLGAAEPVNDLPWLRRRALELALENMKGLSATEAISTAKKFLGFMTDDEAKAA